MSRKIILLRQVALVGYVLLFGGSFGRGALTAQAQDSVIRIDIGVSNQQTLLAGWNNVTGASGDEIVVTVPLVNTLSQATGITLHTAWTANQDDLVDSGLSPVTHNYEGPFPNPTLDGIPASALRDGAYLRDGAKMSITLDGLDISATYDFIFYGASDNSGDYALLVFTGGNTGRTHIEPTLNNADSVGYITGLTADAMHTMVIGFEGRRYNGVEHFPEISNDAVGRLNYIQITEHLLPVPGDYNGDRGVDDTDYNIWSESFGASGAADGNKDGVVNAADYTVWRNALRSGEGGSGNAGVSSVPEPAAAVLAFFGVAAIAAFRRHLRSL